MTFDRYRTYCLSKPGVTEEYPFGGEAVWMKVMGKVFTIASITEIKVAGELLPPFHFVNLKCDPDYAIDLRDRHGAIKPGWHMNKTHWNSVYMDGSLNDSFVLELVDHSYDLVVSALTQKAKKELELLSNK